MWHRRVNAHREETDPLHWVDALNRPACGLAWQQRWRGGFINGLISRYFSVAEAAEIKAKLEPKSK